jgi:hypothetical protein
MGEPIASARDRRLLVGVNQPFSSRVGTRGVATGEGNISAGAPLMELPGGRSSGERRPRGEREERQSYDHGFPPSFDRQLSVRA